MSRSAAEWLALLAAADVEADTCEVAGVAVHVDEECETCSKNLKQTLYVNGTSLRFERSGYKEIVYERWVDSIWGEWACISE